MIRHTSSFFISLLIHTLFFLGLFALWFFWPVEKKEIEKKVLIKMSHLVEKKEIKNTESPKKPKLPKPQNTIKKPKKQKKVEKKEIKKKVKVVKQKIPKVSKELETSKELNTSKVQEIEKPLVEEIVDEVQKPEKVKDIQTKVEKKLSSEKVYMQKHIQQIVSLLRDNLYYPRSARKRGITGEVMISFRLLQNAEVQDIVVLSSDNEVLSRAAIKTIKDLSGEFPKPQEELLLNVPVSYSLSR